MQEEHLHVSISIIHKLDCGSLQRLPGNLRHAAVSCEAGSLPKDQTSVPPTAVQVLLHQQQTVMFVIRHETLMRVLRRIELGAHRA